MRNERECSLSLIKSKEEHCWRILKFLVGGTPILLVPSLPLTLD
jgi:hypothetical protein